MQLQSLNVSLQSDGVLEACAQALAPVQGALLLPPSTH